MRRHPLLWIVLACLPLFLLDLGKPGLNDGEAMFSEVAREMHLSGDWVTPHLNGTRHFDKPAFPYWLVGLGQALFGFNEFAARFGHALCSVGTVAAVGLTGATLYGAQAGWISALVMATSFGHFIFGRLSMPDPPLIFWFCAAILGYVRGCFGSERFRWPWLVVLFAALGFGLLTKGLVGAGLPFAIILIHATLTGHLRKFFSPSRFIVAVVVLLAVAAPWFIAVEKANPGFWDYFFIREHFQRFTGQRYPADEFVPLPLFLGLTLMWTFPWVVVLPMALRRGVKDVMHEGLRRSADFLPLLWAGFIIGLFTLSRSRLEYYSLPAVPALALLVGRFWSDFFDQCQECPSARSTRIAVGIGSAVTAVAAVAAFVLLGPSMGLIFDIFAKAWPTGGWDPNAETMAILKSMRLPTIVAMTTTAAAMAGAYGAIRRFRPRLAFAFMAALTLPFFTLAHWGFTAVEPFQSTKPIAQIVREHATPDDIVVFQEPHEYMWVGGIAFYTERFVHILKDPKFEGVAVKRREPPERFLDEKGLLDLWASEKHVVAVFEKESGWAEKLAAAGPVRVVGESGSRVVVAKPGE